jgi:hypothetical protein
MRVKVRFQFAAVVVLTLLARPTATQSQALKVTPRQATPAVGTGTLSVSAAPSLLSFNLIPGKTATGNNPISIITTWSGSTLGSTMSLYGYFASSNAALSGNVSAAAIPSSAISGQMTTGLPSTYIPFTQTNPVGNAAASLKLFSQAVTGSGAGSRTDALSLVIDLTSLPQLPADTYTGTLIIQAQVL